MARGWESKSVESQIDSAERHVKTTQQPKPNPAAIAFLRQKETLILSRTRILRELETSQNPRYRLVLTKALADLNSTLSRMEGERAAAVRAH